MNRTTKSLGALLLLGALLVFPARSAFAEVNRLVLRVNDRISTYYDYEKLKQDRIRSIVRAGLSEEERQRQLAGAGLETMKSMFEEMLLLSRADQLDVRIPPSELQAALEQTKESFGIGSDEEYDEALRKSGMTREILRKQIENSMRIREVFGREVYPEVVVEEEDLRRYYGTHAEEFATTAADKLREVVVLTSGGLGEAELSGLALELKAAIAAGEAEALLLETQGDGTTSGWIELGWVEAGDLDPQLEGAIVGLEVGSVSDPISGRGGLHLLQLLERRPARVRDFAEVRAEIEAVERDRRFQKKLAEHMSKLENTAFIVAHPPVDAAGFRVDDDPGEPSGVDALVPVEPVTPESG